MKVMTRPYTMKAREKAQDQTRQKIVEAAVRLHQAQGVAATSMQDIAAEAGVGKVTVYRHFADLDAVLGACSGHYFTLHPPPDPAPWMEIGDPLERAEMALAAVYGWFEETWEMMRQVYPEMRDRPVMTTYHELWAGYRRALLAGWQDGGALSAQQERALEAALALFLDFDSWRVLVKVQELSNEEAMVLALTALETYKA